ncbi:MAG: hypothetical protein K2X81_05305 [Candidatus Obscuribacterales bacterium]|nr:hypothetical protein [Candidatus Obscuribacterales bacterium]
MKGKVEKQEAAPLTSGVGLDGDFSPPMSAGIRFSESVNPVSAELKVHKLFSSVTLPVEGKDDNWYQIPKWRAGLYHREKQVDHSKFGDIESVSKVDHLYGMQVDKNGGIWHHDSWPRITKISLDGYSQYKIINRYEPITLSSKEYCVKVSSTNIDVDDKTGKITRVAKQEEFDRYFPAGNGVARGDCLIKGFSARGGTNTEIETCSVEESLVKPFSVLNNFRGKDLHESFVNFLKAHGHTELLPD